MLIQTLKIVGLVGSFLFFFTLKLIAQKPTSLDTLPIIQKVDGVTYEVLSGLAEITSIQKVKAAKESRLGYDEYQVLFRFSPMEGHALLQILEGKELELKLEHRSSSVLLGPAFIKKMNLKVGTKYAMNLFQTKSGGLNVRRYFYEIKAFENQLYKAYDSLIDLLGRTLCLDSVDSMLVEVDYDALTGAARRALMDAELKRGLENKVFVKPQFTKSTAQFLSKHETLLEEYEAAIRVLAQLEEKKYQEQLMKEAAEKKAAKGLVEKIKAMKNETISSVVNQTEIVRGCYYEVVPGLAEVTAINVVKEAAESNLHYNEYQVLFKFTPMEGHTLLEELRDTTLEFFLYHRGDKVRVGPAYIKAKAVHIGTRYAMTLYQKRNRAVCSEQYTYASKALDNDLFEAFPPKTIFIKERRNKLEEKKDRILMNETLGSVVSNEAETEDKASKITTYKAARQDLKQAKLNKRIWRKKIDKAIKTARMNAKAAKQAEIRESIKQKKQSKGIKVGKVVVSKELRSTCVNKKTAFRNARKKAQMAKRKVEE